MSTLILVRHGQATPFDEITDRLSPLGEHQAREVGRHLAQRGLNPDAVVSGALERQRRTAHIAAEVAREHGAHWPERTETDDLNEYAAEGVMKHLAPKLSIRNPQFRHLMEAAEQARGTPEQNRHFQRMLEELMQAYLSGDLHAQDLESWADFRTRVTRALRGLMDGPNGRTVLVFTSGGVIGLTVATVLKAPDASALALNWRVRNASITEFTFGGDRISLDTFNGTGHLPTEMVSWR